MFIMRCNYTLQDCHLGRRHKDYLTYLSEEEIMSQSGIGFKDTSQGGYYFNLEGGQYLSS
jgi:hypothetical protein